MNALTVIEARLAGLVHETARSPAERSRHERVMVARMTAGVLALALIPPVLLWRGAPAVPEHVALVAAAAGPLLAAAIGARSGRLLLAQGVVSASLAAPVVGWAAASGGAASAAALALGLPLEAALSGSRRGVAVAGIVAILALLATAALAGTGAGFPWPAWAAWPAFALAAAGHGAAALLQRARGARPGDGEEGRSLLGAVDDLITWHDRDGQVVEASPAAAGLLGLSPGSLNGRGLLLRVHVGDRPAFLRAIGEAAHGERPAAAEFRVHAGREGEASAVKWVEMRAHRLAGSPDDGRAVVAVTRDVSARKRREEELEGERDAAARADAAKSRLLAAVSHELRTPLNAVSGFAALLAGEGADALSDRTRRDYAAIVRDSSRHLVDVADALLDVASLDTGSFPFAPEPLDVADLVAGICDLVRLDADRAGVALARTVPADLPLLVADRRACRQILLNLLSNALKFTPRGGTVQVGAARDRDRLVLTVSDTGAGVAADDLPRLGEPFFRAGRDHDRPAGAGLGLAVVRGLIEGHRGSLAISSAPGRGTSVAVSLPLDGRSRAVRPPGATVASLSRARALAKVG